MHSKIKPLLTATLILLFMWVPSCLYMSSKLGSVGLVATRVLFESFQYPGHQPGQPEELKITNSYEDFAKAWAGSDSSGYIKAGLGYADGKGIYVRTIPPDPGPKYQPFYQQAPGTPFIIGLMIKFFGSEHVAPYCYLVMAMNFFTAFIVMILASNYVNRAVYLFIAGFLSLYCPPILDLTYGPGLFLSEPLVTPLLALALCALASSWAAIVKENEPNWIIRVGLRALTFGSLIGGVTYFRDSYGAFCYLTCLLLIVRAFLKKRYLKKTLFFSVVVISCLYLVQFPWRERNRAYVNYPCMASSSNFASGMWYSIWQDYKAQEKWCPNCSLGLGNYLSPRESANFTSEIWRDPEKISKKACWRLMVAIARHPVKAFWFKFRNLDTLWFGPRILPSLYAFSVISLVCLLIFFGLTRRYFFPELLALPLFIAALCPIIHYEARYAQPIYWLVSPIAISWLIMRCFTRNKSIQEASPGSPRGASDHSQLDLASSTDS